MLALIGGAKKTKGIEFISHVQTHHCDQLIFRGVTSVINHSIKNVSKMIDEAKEINRMLAKQRRLPNHYQVLHARHHHKPNV